MRFLRRALRQLSSTRLSNSETSCPDQQPATAARSLAARSLAGRYQLSLLGLLSLSFLPGCGSQLTSNQGKDSSCEELCKQRSQCTTVEQDTCTKTCTDNPTISRGGQEVLTSCLAKQDCELSDPTGFLSCMEDGLDGVGVSEDGQAFCDKNAQTLTDCAAELQSTSSTGISSTSCENGVSIIADEVLSELNDCAAKTCTSALLCAASVLKDQQEEVAKLEVIFPELGSTLSGLTSSLGL